MSDATPDRPVEHSYLPPGAPPRNHGHTSAAWTTVIFMLVGGLLGALAVVLTSVLLGAIGAAVIVVGLVAGRIMQHMGYGQVATPTEQAHSGR